MELRLMYLASSYFICKIRKLQKGQKLNEVKDSRFTFNGGQATAPVQGMTNRMGTPSSPPWSYCTRVCLAVKTFVTAPL